MVGGDLHWIWEPYGIYQDVDWVGVHIPVLFKWRLKVLDHRRMVPRLWAKMMASQMLNVRI
jgi:hypothetical protein